MPKPQNFFFREFIFLSKMGAILRFKNFVRTCWRTSRRRRDAHAALFERIRRHLSADEGEKEECAVEVNRLNDNHLVGVARLVLQFCAIHLQPCQWMSDLSVLLYKNSRFQQRSLDEYTGNLAR